MAKKDTVKIKYGASYAVINKTDYDPSFHEVYVSLKRVTKKNSNGVKTDLSFSLEKNSN